MMPRTCSQQSRPWRVLLLPLLLALAAPIAGQDLAAVRAAARACLQQHDCQATLPPGGAAGSADAGPRAAGAAQGRPSPPLDGAALSGLGGVAQALLFAVGIGGAALFFVAIVQARRSRRTGRAAASPAAAPAAAAPPPDHEQLAAR